MNRRQFVIGTLATPVTGLVLPTARAQEAGFLDGRYEWLVDECGEMWPHTGAFEAYTSDDGTYGAALYVTFAADEIEALQCVAPRLEVNFMIGGFFVSSDDLRSVKVSSTLPGGRRKSNTFDYETSELTFRYGNVGTDDLESGVPYEVQLEFAGLEPNPADYPWVSIRFGMMTEDEGTVTLFLTRGYLGDVIHFGNGYQWLPFGG